MARTLIILFWLGLVAQASSAQYGAEVEVLPDYTLKLSLATSASKDRVWQLWQDVENWKKFDTLLEYSHLDQGQKFVTGATGVIKARGAAKTRFELVYVNSGVAFVESLKVPFYQRIELHRYFEEGEFGKTVFTHEVRFKGRFRSLIYLAAAASFKKELPLVMGRLRDVAEQQ